MSLGTTSTPQANTSGQTSSTTSQAVHLSVSPTLRVRGLSGRYGWSNTPMPSCAKSLAIGTRAFDELVRAATSAATFSVLHFSAVNSGSTVKRNARSRTCSASRTNALDVPLHVEHGPGVARGGIESLAAVRRAGRPDVS